jgi:hypothetical protein
MMWPTPETAPRIGHLRAANGETPHPAIPQYPPGFFARLLVMAALKES